jgi:hypothetical protein
MTPDKSGLSVRIPKAGDDQPRLGRVAAIAVVGFAIGVIWPRLAGVKLVPSAPVENEPAAAASSDDPKTGSSASPGAAKLPAAKVVPAAVPEAPAEPSDRFDVSPASVTSCRDAKGARKEKCDSIEVDSLIRPKVLALAGCPAAEGVQGKLSLGIELDFASGKATDVLKGKSTNLPDATADALIVCAKKELQSLSLADVKHEHAKYTVFTLVDLRPPGPKPDQDKPTKEVETASGRATVAWEVGIVRDQPKDGEIVARLMRGTRVVVSGRDGDWYRIKYDAKGAEGWVFRTAIGM